MTDRVPIDWQKGYLPSLLCIACVPRTWNKLHPPVLWVWCSAIYLSVYSKSNSVNSELPCNVHNDLFGECLRRIFGCKLSLCLPQLETWSGVIPCICHLLPVIFWTYRNDIAGEARPSVLICTVQKSHFICDRLVPGHSLHSCEIKSGSGLGMRLYQRGWTWQEQI